MFNVDRMRKIVYRSIPDEYETEIDPMARDANQKYQFLLHEFELLAQKKYGNHYTIEVITYGRYDYSDMQKIKFKMAPTRGNIRIVNMIDEPRG